MGATRERSVPDDGRDMALYHPLPRLTSASADTRPLGLAAQRLRPGRRHPQTHERQGQWDAVRRERGPVPDEPATRHSQPVKSSPASAPCEV